MAIRNDLIQSRSAYIGSSSSVSPSVGNLVVDGNVGIGTTSPANKLDVIGNVLVQGTQGFNATGETASIYVGDIASEIRAVFDGGLDFYQNSVHRMRIQGGTGNVGIGTTAPARILELSQAEPYLRFNPTAVSGAYLLGAADGKFYFTPESSYVATMTLSSGNVGIGTTSPSYKLDLRSPLNTDTFAFVSGGPGLTKGGIYLGNDGTQYSSLWFDNATNDLVIRQNYSSGNLILGTASTEKMRITSAGNVGIGTTNPTYGFVVNRQSTSLSATGTMYIGASLNGGGKGLVIDSTTRTDADAAVLALQIISRTGSTTLGATVGGNVGIGTTSPGDKLDVSGNIGIGNAGNKLYNGSSNDSAGLFFNSNVTNISGYSGINFRSSTTNVSSQTIRMFIQNDGNVGIGTTSPSSKLEIRGAQSASKSSLLLLSKFDYGTTTFFQNYSNTFYANGKSLEIEVETLPMLQLATNNAATEGKVIFPNGNVGVGTTNPASKLHINNSSAISTTFLAGNINGGAYFGWDSDNTGLVATYTNAAIKFGGAYYSSFNEWMRITSAGNVGIGTTSPNVSGYSRALTISSSDSGIELTSASNVVQATIGANTNGLAISGIGTFGVRIFTSASGATSERMRIAANGNVGIGTSSPGKKFVVTGAANDEWIATFTNTGTNPYGVYIDTSANASSVFSFATYTNAGTGFFILNNGNVGIGTTSPGHKLQVLAPSNQQLGLYYDSSNYAAIGSRSNGDVQIYGYTSGVGYRNILLGVDGSSVGGNVGIGTTTPGAKLTVQGDLFAYQTNGFFLMREAGGSSANNAIELNIRSYAGKSGYLTFTESGVADRWSVGVQNGNSTLRFIPDFVTGTPVFTLSNAGAGVFSSSVTARSFSFAIGGFRLKEDSSNASSRNWVLGNDTLSWGDFGIHRSTTQTGSTYTIPFYINPSGNVGINTTTPGSLLTVEQDYTTTAEFGAFGQFSINGKTNTNKKLAIGFNTATDVGFIQAMENGVSYKNLLLNARGGNVGIGTTTPGATLAVGTQSSGSAGSGVAANNSIIGRFGAANTASRVVGLTIANTATATIGNDSTLSFIVAGNYSATGLISTILQDTGTAASDMVFSLFANTLQERMRIQGSTGNVGIGTSSPTAKLEVVGNINTRGLYFYDGGNSGTLRIDNSYGGGIDYHADQNGHRFFTWVSGIGWVQHFTITDAGNVGIGTTSPAALLHVSQPSANTIFRLGNNTTYDQFIYFNGNNDWALGMDYSNSNAFVLSNASSIGTNDRLVVTTGGNVGIGTTSPSGNLQVLGSSPIIPAIFNLTHFAGVGAPLDFTLSADAFGNAGIGLSLSTNLTFSIAGSERMRIASSGSVGVGTSAPAASAIMHLSSTTQGFLPPQMKNSEMNAIASPATGLVVYDITNNKLTVYNGSGWVPLH